MSSPPPSNPSDVAPLERYYVDLGAAFVRGRLGDRLSARARTDNEKAFREGFANGLKMHKFKRLDDRLLVRVRRVLSLLKGLAPLDLLDVGSGRGAFLWPLLDAFPDLLVTAIDINAQRASDLNAIGTGGLWRLSAKEMDATDLKFDNRSFDAVTLLEVLEHMPTPQHAANEAMRVAKKFVVASVPSRPDDNPEHIHLFDTKSFVALFEDAGARRVSIDHVPGHMIAVAMVAPNP